MILTHLDSLNSVENLCFNVTASMEHFVSPVHDSCLLNVYYIIISLQCGALNSGFRYWLERIDDYICGKILKVEHTLYSAGSPSW